MLHGGAGNEALANDGGGAAHDGHVAHVGHVDGHRRAHGGVCGRGGRIGIGAGDVHVGAVGHGAGVHVVGRAQGHHAAVGGDRGETGDGGLCGGRGHVEGQRSSHAHGATTTAAVVGGGLGRGISGAGAALAVGGGLLLGELIVGRGAAFVFCTAGAGHRRGGLGLAGGVGVGAELHGAASGNVARGAGLGFVGDETQRDGRAHRGAALGLAQRLGEGAAVVVGGGFQAACEEQGRATVQGGAGGVVGHGDGEGAAHAGGVRVGGAGAARGLGGGVVAAVGRDRGVVPAQYRAQHQGFGGVFHHMHGDGHAHTRGAATRDGGGGFHRVLARALGLDEDVAGAGLDRGAVLDRCARADVVALVDHVQGKRAGHAGVALAGARGRLGAGFVFGGVATFHGGRGGEALAADEGPCAQQGHVVQVGHVERHGHAHRGAAIALGASGGAIGHGFGVHVELAAQVDRAIGRDGHGGDDRGVGPGRRHVERQRCGHAHRATIAVVGALAGGIVIARFAVGQFGLLVDLVVGRAVAPVTFLFAGGALGRCLGLGQAAGVGHHGKTHATRGGGDVAGGGGHRHVVHKTQRNGRAHGGAAHGVAQGLGGGAAGVGGDGAQAGHGELAARCHDRLGGVVDHRNGERATKADAVARATRLGRGGGHISARGGHGNVGCT